MGGGHLVYRFEACAATADGVLWSAPLHAAAGAVSTWVSEWTRRHGPIGGGRLRADARLGLIQDLLARGADPNARITESAMLMFYIGYPKKGAFEPFAPGTGALRGATPLWVACHAVRSACALPWVCVRLSRLLPARRERSSS